MSGDDIVERLRVDCVADEHTWEELEQFALRNEAADAIASRDAEVERLRAEVFAEGYKAELRALEAVRLRALITEWDAAHTAWLSPPGRAPIGAAESRRLRLHAAEDALAQEVRCE